MHHKVETVGDLVTQESLLENPEHNSNDKKCKCHECTRYRKAGCTDPNTCFNEAGVGGIIICIWNPPTQPSSEGWRVPSRFPQNMTFFYPIELKKIY